MRRAPTLDIGTLLGAVARRADAEDDVAERILDAAASVLASGGLRRCTVEEIAEVARLGRTTVYRRFEGREEIVHAVLAREARRTLDAVARSVADVEAIEDRVVDGLLAALTAFRSSPILPMVRSEPELLALVTTQAGPLLAMAADVLVGLWRRDTGGRPTARVRHVAEVLVRLGVSLAVAPSQALDLDDRRAARRMLHHIVDPLLGGGP